MMKRESATQHNVQASIHNIIDLYHHALCADGILRMLHFNEAPSVLKKREAEETASPYKILVLDSFSKSIIAPLVGVQDLRQKGGVTLHLVVDSQREAIPDVPAVYFVQANPQNVQRIVEVPPPPPPTPLALFPSSLAKHRAYSPSALSNPRACSV